MKYTDNGQARLSFTLAVPGKDDSDVQFVQATAWGDTATELHERGKMTKGAECYIEGSLQLREWDAPDGKHHATLNLSCWVVQLIGASSISRKPQQQAQRPAQGQRPPRGGYGQIVDGAGTRLPLPNDPEPAGAGRGRASNTYRPR
jgi:single-stranded DNA-binding protein